MRHVHRLLTLAACAAGALALTACGTPDPFATGEAANSYPPYPYAGNASTYPYGVPPNSNVSYVETGRIAEIVQLTTGTNPSGNVAAGTVAGGVVGGVLGNQIGHGSGRAAATILGAVGGAAVGNRLAQNSPYASAGPVYRVTIQTDNGVMRQYDVNAVGDLRPGDRVRIENGAIYHM